MNKVKIYVLMLFGLICIANNAAEITDMAGRRVTVPDIIEKVLPYDNKTNILIYSISGKKMIAKAWAGENSGMKLIASDYLAKPEIDTKNAEEVLKLNPDIEETCLNLLYVLSDLWNEM